MDTLTHLALGACIGEAFLGRNIGKKAMVWGGFAQILPDIDIVASLWTDPAENLLVHRGFTHSFLFVFLSFPVLALLADRWHRPHNVRMGRWLWFFGVEILVHVLLDGFNTYGTGWLEPFSHYRFSLNAIYVADPLFSIFPALGCLGLILLRKQDKRRRYWYAAGIGGSFLYLSMCMVNKVIIERDVRTMLAAQRIPYTRYMTTPTPFNNMLWYVVAGNDSGYYVGFRALRDSRPLALEYFPRNDYLLAGVSDEERLQRLKRFSGEFYTVEERQGSLIFNDLRFGQIAGWRHPRAGFVFYFYLLQPEENELVMQRGRFRGWDREVWISLFERIRGN